MHLLLERDTARADAMLGTIRVGTLILWTLERPWIAVAGALCGEPGLSCVPAGDYALELHDSVKHPKTFALLNPALHVYHQPGDIPAGCVGRSACLIHSANFASQVEGCIAVGRGRAIVNGLAMVTDSRAALSALLSALPWIEGHTISIVDQTVKVAAP